MQLTSTTQSSYANSVFQAHVRYKQRYTNSWQRACVPLLQDETPHPCKVQVSAGPYFQRAHPLHISMQSTSGANRYWKMGDGAFEGRTRQTNLSKFNACKVYLKGMLVCVENCCISEFHGNLDKCAPLLRNIA